MDLADSGNQTINVGVVKIIGAGLEQQGAAIVHVFGNGAVQVVIAPFAEGERPAVTAKRTAS